MQSRGGNDETEESGVTFDGTCFRKTTPQLTTGKKNISGVGFVPCRVRRMDVCLTFTVIIIIMRADITCVFSLPHTTPFDVHDMFMLVNEKEKNMHDSR